MRSGASDPVDVEADVEAGRGRSAASSKAPPHDDIREYAGIVTRLTALIVDVVVLTLVGLAISVLPPLAWSQVVGRSPEWLGMVCGTVASVLPWAYFTIGWWLGGQTVGGMLLGTAVRRTGGRRMALIPAAIRAAIGLALAPIWVIGLVWVLFDRRRRAWHDIVFRTVARRTLPSAVTLTVPAVVSTGLDK